MSNETAPEGNGTHSKRSINHEHNALGALEQLAGVILGRTEKGEPVAKVASVRTLGEKAIDTGLMAGAIVVGGTAVCAIAKFVFGFGKASKTTTVLPTT